MSENRSPISRLGEYLGHHGARFGLLRGLVVVAAVLDVLLVLYLGGNTVPLIPGILGLSACALWVRSSPVAATLAGSGVLLATTLFLRLEHGVVYKSEVLANITLGETLAGIMLLYGCVRGNQTWRGAVAGFLLVASTGAAVLLRLDMDEQVSGDLMITAMAGLALVVGTIAAGVYFRTSRQGFAPTPTGPFGRFMQGQWPTAALLAGLLALEAINAFDSTPRILLALPASLVAAIAALFAARHPVGSVVVLSAAILTGGALKQFTHAGGYLAGAILPTMVAAGAVVVVVQVRRFAPRAAAIGIATLTVVVACAVLAFGRGLTSSSTRTLAVLAALMLGMCIAVGLYLRSRDSERIRTVHTAVADAQTMERMALARELHDVVAHHVTGIVVQAQAARMVAENDPQAAHAAMGRIENAGTEALAAMRRLVGSMRGEAPAGSTEFSEQATTDLAADLRTLVDGGSHGVSTTLSVDVPSDLPQEVARSALRIVQEALTNVGKHAVDASGATVTVDVSYSELHIAVADNGTVGSPKAAGGTGGYGLIGMRERVDLLGGRLIAEPGPISGWLVEVWLPYDEPAEGEP